ncbi:glycosyltransferase family 4 protein [Bradyrhizobium diazoefficiens]|uniref:glycosyltransferase family 4 protein n=1 Tax=Bradyrhizobium diazoefficiens TaxID=1355477 RepID=UPI00190A7A91|nr:glycosyltransferase family 1 protein [Bradyrhizobium diazoefficiens]MBK3665292.1 glycosyltransferase family 4 protein [Bradyrhizobium diazoefficiens]
MKLFINGRFLSQKLTGVQRYAAEMVKAVDSLLVSDRSPALLREAEWQLLVPADASETIGLDRIKIRRIGRLKGHAWDQIDLAHAATGGRLISLANAGPIFHRDQIVVIHDAQVFRRPDFFGWRYLAVHRTMDRLLARRATIATVSAFSRRELAAVLGLAASDIPIFPNSAEHFAATQPDPGILNRLGVLPRSYFLFVGSRTKNKNLSVAIEAIRLLNRPDIPLVIVGGDNSKVFHDNSGETQPGLILAGRLTDSEIAALYARATAFIFPSLYEGFGVPPLEAMLFACPVIASTAEAVKETCGDAAAYFDATDAKALSERMRERLAKGPISDEERSIQQQRLAQFSWRTSAEALLRFLAQPRNERHTRIT